MSPNRPLVLLAALAACPADQDPASDSASTSASPTKHWLHHGDHLQSDWHTRAAQGALWDLVEVLGTGAPMLTSAGASAGCNTDDTAACDPCKHGGPCGRTQDVFLEPE